MEKDVCSLLKDGREFLADESHFCTGWYAEDAGGGQMIYPHDEATVRCCGAGAIWRALGHNPYSEEGVEEGYKNAIIRLGTAMGTKVKGSSESDATFAACHQTVTLTNDTKGWKNVIDGYDAAIKDCA